MLKKLCLYLALLNFCDGILSYIGLRLHLIDEANPLMKGVYEQQPLAFLAIKISLSILLFFLLYLDKIPQNKWMYPLVICGVFGYTFILCLHGGWIVMTLV